MGFEVCGHLCPECDDNVSYPELLAKAARYKAALLAVEHEVITAEDPKDMHDAVIDIVEGVLGKPPRAALSEGTGEKE